MNTKNCCSVAAYVLVIARMLFGSDSRVIAADDWDKFTEAPPNHAILSDTLNGWNFVPKELKATYDKSLRRLESLQTEMDSGLISAKEATTELAQLRSSLKTLRSQIEASRVHVVGAEIYEQTETIEFEFGPEKRLAITSNHVRVVGWEGPKVKVELRKRVLSTDKKPVEKHLSAIKIVHQHAPAAFAGQTDAQWDAQEAEFMANDGAKLDKEQLAVRRTFVDEIRQSYAHHRELLGKDIDQLTVVGLDYGSNDIVEKKVKSDGGDGRSGSVRQRYAELTVYVPSCVSVCIRGARRGLQIENLKALLTIVDEESTDSDARGRFEVQGLQGDLICRNYPLHVIANVNGHVAIESTTEFGVEGAGTSHHGDLRDMTPARPFAVDVHDVTEGVNLHYGRVQLDLKNVRGRIDIVNEFGDTHFSADEPMAREAHRIISQSGRIDVELSDKAWESTSVLAVTNHGGVRTNVSREEFDDFHLSGQDKHDRVRRDWSGFRRVVEGEDRFAAFSLIDRFAAVLENRTRETGLDLLTRNGPLVVLRK